MKIYGIAPATLSRWGLLVLIVWCISQQFAQKNTLIKRLVTLLSVLLLAVSVYGIARFTLLGRTPSDSHQFAFAAQYTNEFYREMFMNALLYYPLGLSLTVLIGPWSIFVAFTLSTSIETWQYFAGTGLAQGTDVIMNTLGTAIGAIPWFVVRWIVRKQPPPNQGEE